MNDALTLQWVKKIYGSFSFNKRMLVWNSFKCHISEEVKSIVEKQNSIMVVIPGGCTKFLQHLDVSINKPFKEIFREKYDAWYREGIFEYTKGGNVKAPAYEKQIKWVLDAWETVKPDIIKKSFDCCGITIIEKSKISYIQPGKPAEAAYSLITVTDPRVGFILVEEPEENFDNDLILDDIGDENLDLDNVFVVE